MTVSRFLDGWWLVMVDLFVYGGHGDRAVRSIPFLGKRVWKLVDSAFITPQYIVPTGHPQ